jgi:hypothetical protein
MGANAKKARLRILLIVGTALVGIAIQAWTLSTLGAQDLCGSDFAVFYAGGQLVGTPALYSAAAAQAIQKREMGCTTGSAIFIRLPYFAAFMWPWARLPFWSSFVLWRTANLAAIGVFIWLWPSPREWSLLVCAWSLPLGYAITNGQDVGFLLMWLAIGQALVKSGAPFKGGLSVAMCAAKFHLFVLLPLVFVAGLRKFGYGLVAGGSALLVLCFVAQGRDWLIQFLTAAADSRIDPAPGMLFNIRAIAHGSIALEVLLAGSVLATALYVFRYGDLSYKVAAMLSGGLLLSHHQTISDAALLIPPALLLQFHPTAGYTKLLALYLVSPLGYFLMMTPRGAEVPRVLLLAFAWLLAWEVRTGDSDSIETRT